MEIKIKLGNRIPPILIPILFFATVIICGAILLHQSFSYNNISISWIDSLFTSVSATCVTGLTVIDTGTSFNQTGQLIILMLIQLGGLGIMSFTSLTIFLWRKRISLIDRIAVGQSLLYDPSFNLGKFLIRLVTVTFLIEGIGAFLLFAVAPVHFSPFSALFHSISAFCNAGFSLFTNSLMAFRGNWAVNIIIMGLIILGGLGFFVVIEGYFYFFSILGMKKIKPKISWNSAVIIKTSLFLIVVGWFFIYFAEFIGYKKYLPFSEAVLASLFQSVTSRTAGFNTLDIAQMTNVSMIFIIMLMFVGGAPGSCAGGIKVTTFRLIWAFIISKLKGRHQVIIGKFAVDKESINRAIVLIFFSFALIFFSILLLDITEGGDIPHMQARGRFMEIVFEVVSAFGTVGLSTGLTAKLSIIGKITIIALMFIGRLGPLLLLSALQSLQTSVIYSIPEEPIVIG